MLVAAAASGLAWIVPAGTRAAQSDGWQIPRDAGSEVSPLPETPERIAKGKEIYESKCRRCHGTSGRGNGPDADPDDPPGNLTDASRAPRNPDGVMFYKVWNGRNEPKMPAFKTDMSREDVWTVIQYVKTLRR
jgi:mono/diheme cytochrome c family protein